jgi:hypothetical protein
MNQVQTSRAKFYVAIKARFDFVSVDAHHIV